MTDKLGRLIGRGREAEIYAWGEDRVLKLFFPAMPQVLIETEAQAARIAYEAGVPTPAVGETIEVDGRHGVVFERVDGPPMTAQLMTHLWQLRRLARQSAEVQVAIHACKAPELISLKDHARREIERSAEFDTAVREVVLRRLERLPDGDSLYHGDFYPNNVIMSPRGPVVIDWSSALRSDPLADVAWTWQLNRMNEPPADMKGRWLIPVLQAAYQGFYLRRYRQLRPFADEELTAWKLPMVALRLAHSMHILPEERRRIERRRMMDYLERVLEGRATG
jgi:uncharacterized protein (TIGR02172 family)